MPTTITTTHLGQCFPIPHTITTAWYTSSLMISLSSLVFAIARLGFYHYPHRVFILFYLDTYIACFLAPRIICLLYVYIASRSQFSRTAAALDHSERTHGLGSPFVRHTNSRLIGLE
ncbi:hypothetical protein OE88DRAFT_715443 [Heliocybe sulcata]|uniref:Uncharacterized protein n=1 Tax=Heliocybe sulcata TaxID=5364 RepID=A0A5C3NFR1_9AGAM|nr:hypothetical protein OE88DRAFT_715443 [Heliocybe sulcata]